MEQIIINITKNEDTFTFIIKSDILTKVANEETEKEQLFIEELNTIIKKYKD